MTQNHTDVHQREREREKKRKALPFKFQTIRVSVVGGHELAIPDLAK